MSEIKEKEIVMSAEEETVIKWKYGMMGDFRIALMEAICRADDINLAKLKVVFPDEANCYFKFSHESGWFEKAQKKAKELGWIR